MNLSKLSGGVTFFYVAALAAAFAIGALPGAALSDTTAATYKVIEWDALVPKEWDPLKRFLDSNVRSMDDGNPKVLELMREMRTAWDNAPTVAAMNGKRVMITGYLVPIEETKNGLKEFLLVPYFGACIHSPPPPANQIIHVVLANEIKGFRTMDTVWVSGTLSTRRKNSEMGTSGYRMDALVIEKYISPKR